MFGRQRNVCHVSRFPDRLTVQTDERVLGGGGRRHISVPGRDRRTRKPVQNAVARLTRQPAGAYVPLSPAHYRMPSGKVGQQQTVDGDGGMTVVMRFAASARIAAVRRQLIRGVQHRVLVVPRQTRLRPACAKTTKQTGSSSVLRRASDGHVLRVRDEFRGENGTSERVCARSRVRKIITSEDVSRP